LFTDVRGRGGLAVCASTHERAPPTDKLSNIVSLFHTVKVVHFKSSDEHESSLTL